MSDGYVVGSIHCFVLIAKIIQGDRVVVDLNSLLPDPGKPTSITNDGALLALA